MTFVLIVLMGGGFASGSVFKIGTYKTQDSCQAARAVLIDEKTPLRSSYVLCVPIDSEG